MHRIFICYRREDSSLYALSLAQTLRTEFGEDEVYMDTSSIHPGSRWPDELRNAVNKAEVVVVVIGPKWETLQDPNSGRQRLASPDDWVRQELCIALTEEKLVVPILVDSALLPSRNLLPVDVPRDSRAIKLLAHRKQGYFQGCLQCQA